jgi:hypothetical protein
MIRQQNLLQLPRPSLAGFSYSLAILPISLAILLYSLATLPCSLAGLPCSLPGKGFKVQRALDLEIVVAKDRKAISQYTTESQIESRPINGHR